MGNDGIEGLRGFLNMATCAGDLGDMLMRTWTGWSLCRQIRKKTRSQYTYIIPNSVDGKAGYLDGMQAGADDFINKHSIKMWLGARLVGGATDLSLQAQSNSCPVAANLFGVQKGA